MFVKHECLKRFLDPKNYPPQMEGWYRIQNTFVFVLLSTSSATLVNKCFSFLDEAAEQVAMFFRSEPSWELVEILPDIGKFTQSGSCCLLFIIVYCTFYLPHCTYCTVLFYILCIYCTVLP